MQRFYDVVLDQFGNPANGVLVTVYDAGTTTPATLYRDSDNLLDPINVISNPFTTSASGIVAFAAVNGQYTINYSGSSITPRTFTWVTFTDGSVSSVPWGSITGTLSDQTDLDTALGLKAPSASPTFTVSATFSFLTNTRVPFAGVGGALTDNANFTYTVGTGLKVNDATATTSTTTGALIVSGGIGVAGTAWVGVLNSVGAISIDAGSGSSNAILNLTGRNAGVSNNARILANFNGGISLIPNANDITVRFLHPTSTPTIGHTIGPAFNLYDSRGATEYASIKCTTTNVSGAGASSGYFSFTIQVAGTLTELMRVEGSTSGISSSYVRVYATNTATSPITGAFRVDGGAGVSGAVYTGTSFNLQTANAAEWIHGSVSELLTLSTAGTTTDTTANLLPANSIIEAVVARVTTTITTATSWQLGDPTTAGRFTNANSTMTAGTTDIGLKHQQGSIATDATGPVQTAAAKVRVTTVGTPGAGVIRITVFYRSFVPPQS